MKKTSTDTLAECEYTQSSGINSYRHADDGTLLKNLEKGLTTLGYSVDGDDIGYTQALSVVYSGEAIPERSETPLTAAGTCRKTRRSEPPS